MFTLRSLGSSVRPSQHRKAVSHTPLRFLPQLEKVEDRAVPAHLLPADLVTITDIALDAPALVDGVLTAASGTVEGTLAGLPFTTDINNFALDLLPDDPNTPAVECPVLNLALAPIDVDLLGLHVDTSAICLDITASPAGGLLGDLLCGLNLNAVTDLTNLDGLLGTVGNILDGVLTGALSKAGPPAAGATDICDGTCEILDLAVGPVDLSVLGLNVGLDNCDNGPVQVCVSASKGEGLVGDLLCGISSKGLNLDLNDITQIGGQVVDAAADGVISGHEFGQLKSLVNKLKH